MASLTLDLQCVECARAVSGFERGWRAYLAAMDPGAEEPVEVAIYCPECAVFEVRPDSSLTDSA